MIERAELHDAAQKAFPADQLKPARDDSWKLIAEMGWLLLPLPEDAGGLGLGRDSSAAIHFEPPVAIERLMQFLMNASAPCALFTLGVTVALRPLKAMPWEVPYLTAVKLLLHPILMFLLLSLFGPFDQLWIDTAILMAALPPALNVFVFARQYDTWVEQASGAVLVGTVVSVLTLTSVMWMVKTGTLPPLLFR